MTEEYKAKLQTKVEQLQKEHINLCYELGNIKYRMAIDEQACKELTTRIQSVNQRAYKLKTKLGDENAEPSPDDGIDNNQEAGTPAENGNASGHA